MAETVSFKAALGRLGLNANTQTAIVSNGIETIRDLLELQDEDLTSLPRHLRDWRIADADEAHQVLLPLMALRRLRAMRHWALSQQFLGVLPNAVAFSPGVLAETLERMRDDVDYTAARKEADVQKPQPLKDMVKWTSFWELFVTYFSQLKGAANAPLTYLLREHGEVTAAIRAAPYASDADRLIATVVHEGRHYELDNVTLYDQLKPLVINGPGWAFVRQFDKRKDGRAAVLALKAQAEGESVKIMRKAAAYASIINAAFRGNRRGYTFANYVTIHQEAHNELLDLDEPVAESKKVTDFLAGIQDPSLVMGKTVLMSDPTRLEDFKACQQYLSTLIQTLQTQAKADRQVKGVDTKGEEEVAPSRWLTSSRPARTRMSNITH